jgi:DNA repair exonuclease SbcCD ATPase subunit
MLQLNDIKTFVDELRKFDLENERVQENIDAAIVYLDLAIHEAAQQRAQQCPVCLGKGHSLPNDPEVWICNLCGGTGRITP